MRSQLLPVVLALGLGLAGAAFAATDTSGTIKAIDAKALTVTLEDGTVFYLPAGFKLDGFKVGEKVMVTWDMMGDKHEVSAMKAS